MKTAVFTIFSFFMVQSLTAQETIVLYGLEIFFNNDPFSGGSEGMDLVSIDPWTGEKTNLFEVEGALTLASGNSSYNAAANQYFFQGFAGGNNKYFYNLDLNTNSVAASVATAESFVEMEYNYSNGKIYALRLTPAVQTDPFNPTPDDLDLMEVDPETGEVTLVSDLPEVGATGQGNSTFDPINNHYIFLNINAGAYSITAIDVLTGETAYNTPLQPTEGIMLAFEYDWTNSRILGIRQTSEFDPLPTDPTNFSIKNYLAEINPETGEVTDISVEPAFTQSGVAIGGVAFDQKSGTYITYTNGSTLGMISAETGELFHTMDFPVYYYELQVDNLEFAQNFLSNSTVSTNTPITEELDFYPNPVQDRLTLSNLSNADSGQLYVTDMQGKLLLTEKVRGEGQTVSVKDLPQGVYLLRLESDDTTAVGKFIKQ